MPYKPLSAIIISYCFCLTITAANISKGNTKYNKNAFPHITENAVKAPADNYEATDTSRVFDLDEVVVISQPKELLRLRQQPLSSSVFTGNEIGALGASDLNDLAGYMPSFAMPEYGSRLTSSIYIRGIGSRVNSPAIGIYIDGIPLVSKNSFNFHSYQLDRVDVLRGPQGTLYGMNTEGGLVRMHTKSPMKYQGTDIKISLGTYLRREAEAAVYRRLSDKWAVSVAAFYNGQNGFMRNSTTCQRADRYDEGGAKTRIIFKPTTNLTADFTADYQQIWQDAFPYGILDTATGHTSAPSANRRNTYKRNMFNTGLNLNITLGRLSLNSTTSYQYLKDDMNMDQDYLPEDYMHLRQRQLMNALTQEFTLKSDNKGVWQWLAGVYCSGQWLKTDAPVFFDDDFTSRISTGIRSAIYNAILKSMTDRMIAAGMPPAAAQAAAAATIERAGGVSASATMKVPALFHTPQANLGIFHESSIKITDRLTATLGLRYDYNRVRIKYGTSAAMAITANVMGQEAISGLTSILNDQRHDDHNQLLPKAGLCYKMSDNGSNIYASVSKGYRAGGYNIQMFSDILQTELNSNSDKGMGGNYEIKHTAEDYERIRQAISYKPEESFNYEVGAHLNLFGNSIHADIAGYYMQIRNQQLSVMAGDYGFGRMMINAGKSRSCGMEVALRGNAFDDRFSWAVNYGLTHSIFKEYKEKDGDVETDYEGRRVPFIPMHTLGARADYTIRPNHTHIRSIVIGADITACGRTYWDEANTYSQPLYALLGAHTEMNFKNICMRLWCRNLTDTHYNTFAFDSEASGRTVYLAQKGAPIQAGIDIKLHF